MLWINQMKMDYSGRVIRRQYTFRGIIQGVGFRPTIYRCAASLGLSGFVRNQRSEVLAEIQGPPKAVEAFPGLLRDTLPQAAIIEKMESREIPPVQEGGFRIVESLVTHYSFPPIPPDLALCPQCRAELFNPADRRYLYPFITCTQCGPRYTIVEDTPFDRETTSMIDFPQCAQCLAEYTDPQNRRFHAQTNSCPQCGPQLVLKSVVKPGQGAPVSGDPLVETVRALVAGKIVAIQGIGGFHLAADPRSKEAVARLRQDKERVSKPFALMVADVKEAGRLCRMRQEELRLLASSQSPIVIAPRAQGIPDYFPGVSDTRTLGIMLPYTPLHQLLFHHPQVSIPYRHLIMTSGNRKGEPIVTEPGEALTKLGDIADLILHHNRRIIFRTDDSIIRLGASHDAVLLRRSRGYVPRLIPIGGLAAGITLGLGGDLKSAPALARGDHVYLAPYLGDLEDPRTQEDFQHQLEKMLALYNVRPEVLVYDLHPRYYSTQWARAYPLEQKFGVQHHHAHLLSVMAEHQLEEAIGLAFDGTGYGTDGTVWGGEFLHATRGGFRRLGCFKPFPLPGGESAVRHPIRIALALLADTIPESELTRLIRERSDLQPSEIAALLQMVKRKLNSPLCSSAGRIFDAAAALLGLVEKVSYEGEGPIRLEGFALQAYGGEPLANMAPTRGMPAEETLFSLASLGPAGSEANRRMDSDQSASPPPGSTPIQPEAFEVDMRPLLQYLARNSPALQSPDRESVPRILAEPIKRELGRLALLLHRTMARAARAGAQYMAELTGLKRLALSGGVFQNTLLLDLLLPALESAGFTVYTNRLVPPGDGGISLGQVYFQP